MGRALVLMLVLTLAGCGGDGSDGGDSGGRGGATISGRLTVPAGTYTDAPGGERPIANPATVSAGASAGAAPDRYAATLAKGQAVSIVATGGQTLILQLCPEARGACASARVDQRRAVGTVLAPADDKYHLTVSTVRGRGLYVLGVAGGSAEADIAAAAGPFVPGEVLLRLRKGAEAAAVTDGLRRLGITTSAPMLVHLDTPESRHLLGRLGVDIGGEPASRLATLRTVAELRRHPDVRYAEPNYLWRRQRVPNDPRYSEQWQYPAVGLPAAWDLGIGSGADVTVAVVDDGIRRHVDLRDRLLFEQGYDFASNPFYSNDGDGIDPDPTDPARDGIYHGTEVAGLVAAATDNGLGVAGSAWHAARVLPVRVGSAARITLNDVISGVRYAAGLGNPAGPRQASPRAEIINLSLGGPGGAALAEEFQAVRERGVIVVAAAGNTGDATPSYPAAHDGVLGVAATGRDGMPAAYSTAGASVSLAAPGGDAEQPVETLSGDDAYQGVVGTSFAAPQVAGVIALMKAAHPGLTPEAVSCGLRAGELTDGEAGVRTPALGYGRLDALRAVRYARRLAAGEEVVTPRVDALPSRLDFGSLPRSMEIRLRVICGDGALSGPPVAASAWLNVTVIDEAERRYRVVVDRSRLDPGVNRATVTVSIQRGETLAIPVTAVAEPVPVADAGRQFVQVYRWADYVGGAPALRQTSVDGSEGYRYRFDGLAAGRYAVLASSDLDDNGLLCELAEICGGWPDGTALSSLTLDSGARRLGVDIPLSTLTPLAPARRLGERAP